MFQNKVFNLILLKLILFKKFLILEDRKAIRQFFSIGGYYKEFIQILQGEQNHYKGLYHKMGNEQQKVFKDIKHAICTATLMRHPNPTKPFIFGCDAFFIGLGAALHKLDNYLQEYSVVSASWTSRPNRDK